MVLPIGKQAGVWARKHGAAKFMAKAVQLLGADVEPHPLHMIVRLDSQIGSQAGALPRRGGAVLTQAKDAQAQEVGVLE